MSARYRFSLWDVANGILAALLLITLVGGPRRLPPDWLTPQTWSLRWEGPDGKPLSTNFIFQTFRAREKFGPFLHEYHWFGRPTIDMPVLPDTKLPSEIQVPPGEHKRLLGTFVE